MSNQPDQRAALAAIAQRHQISVAAVAHLLEALRRGNGTAAQFNHPELGGMGQWMASGMIMIGDWNNHALKATIAQLCAELAPLASRLPETAAAATNFAHMPSIGSGQSANWWPEDLGVPAGSGSQNGIRYAYFAAKQRLVLEIAGRVTIYDTLDHQITGVAQQQGSDTSLRFRSQRGAVKPAELPRVAEYDL